MSFSRTPCRHAAFVAALVLAPALARAQDADSAARVAAPRALRATGAQVVTIFPDSFPDAPRTLTELLTMAAPGVFVQHASGATAAGSWLSIRDAAVVRGEQPLVVVDGIRTVAAVARVAQTAERRAPSRLDEIPVADVERIDILAGPAAAARYGREARAGVIEITTRQPGRGAPRLRASLGAATSASGDDFPRNSVRLGSDNSVCRFGDTRAVCASATSSSYTPLLDASPFRTAAAPQGYLGVSGGLAALGYALDLSRSEAAGVLAGDAADLSTGAARIALSLGGIGRLEMTSRAAFRGASTPFEGDASIVSSGLRGYYDCTPTTPCAYGDTVSHGYGYYPPDSLARRAMKHRIQHFTNGATFVAEPLPWLSLRSLASVDAFADRGGFVFQYAGTGWTGGGFYGVRNRRDERAVRDVLGQDVVARHALGSFDLTTALSLRGDHERAHTHAEERQGDDSIYSAWWVWGRGAIRRQTITLAPRLANGRGSIGAGVVSTRTRFEGWGVKTPATLDGSADATWQLADAADGSWLRTLVARGAVGQVSAYPARDEISHGTNYVVFGTVTDENRKVHPDRTYEGEAGLDLTMVPASGRLSLTAYRRRETHHGLYLLNYMGYPVPLDAVRRVVKGLELSNALVPVATERVRLETNLDFTLQADRVVSETGGPAGIFLDQYGYLASLQLEKGKSVESWRSSGYVYQDTNGDGYIDNWAPANPGVVGRSRPSRFGTLDTRLTLAQRWTLGANLGYLGGHKVLDKVETLRCMARLCDAVFGSSLADQAHAVLFGGRDYFVSGEALRIRELSLAYGAPALARLTHASGVRVTVAVRNVATFSHARHLDPETELPAPGLDRDAVQDPGLALPRTVAVRLSASY